jgi:hypothetical protein
MQAASRMDPASHGKRKWGSVSTPPHDSNKSDIASSPVSSPELSKIVSAEEQAVLDKEKVIVLHHDTHIDYWRDRCKTWEKETNMDLKTCIDEIKKIPNLMEDPDIMELLKKEEEAEKGDEALKKEEALKEQALKEQESLEELESSKVEEALKEEEASEEEEDSEEEEALKNGSTQFRGLIQKLRAERQKLRAERQTSRAERQTSRAALRAKDGELRAKDGELRAEKQTSRANVRTRKVLSILMEVERKAGNLHSALQVLSGLSQAEGTKAANTVAANALIKSEVESKKKEADPEAHRLPRKANIADTYATILESPGVYHEVFDSKSLRELVVPSSVNRVSDVLQAFVDRAKFLSRTLYQKDLVSYKGKLKCTLEKVKASFDLAVLGGETGEVSTEGSLDWPGPTSQENNGTHKIIQCILYALALCKDETKTPEASPTKSRVKSEVVLEGTETRKKRRCDMAVWIHGRYLYVMRDDCIELVIEQKPGQRMTSTILDMLNEARDQTLSHLSKALLQCLNYCGAGIPTHATGVIVTFAFVQVVRLELIDPGTSRARVSLVQSELFPLLSLENFEKWFRSDNARWKLTGHQAAIEAVKGRLYDPDGKGGVDRRGTPLGIKALWKLMNVPRAKLVGPTWEKLSKDLGPLLGQGTFAMVHAYAPKKDCAVIKVSRFGRVHHLEQEARILGIFCKGEQCDNIPKLVKCICLDVTIGKVPAVLPAIVTTPLGKSISLAIDESRKTKVLHTVTIGIQAALNYMHKRNIAHNDVSVKNIIMVGTGNEMRAVLIDYGIASSLGSKMEGFQGTTEVAHREIHLNSSAWCPVAEYDFTSLAYTLIIIKQGQIPWIGFSDCPVKDVVELNRRYEVASENLQSFKVDGDFPKESFGEWSKWLAWDNKLFRRACNCILPCSKKYCGCAKHSLDCTAICSCNLVCTNLHNGIHDTGNTPATPQLFPWNNAIQ